MPVHATREILTLHEPNGHEFDVVLVAASHDRIAEGGPLDVRITFDLGWDTYDRAIQIFTLFHCPPDVCGDGPEGGLIAGKRVRVEARLDDALAREHFADIEGDAGAEGVARRLIALRDGDREHALLETEAWYALAVTQALDLPEDAPADASLREGYRTTWMDARTVGG